FLTADLICFWQKLTTSSKLISLFSSSAAILGESGALKRQGEIKSRFFWLRGLLKAFKILALSLFALLLFQPFSSKPLIIGFKAKNFWLFAANLRHKFSNMKVLPILVPVAVIKKTFCNCLEG